MHHAVGDGARQNPFGGNSVTNVSIGICIAMGLVSFLGYLPRFTEFFVLTLHSFALPFPKPWVLVTSTFYCSSLFSGVLSAIMVIAIGKIIEPMIGSREFLRLFIMIGFYTNILMIILAGFLYLLTGSDLLLYRPFETGNAPSAAITMTMTHLLMSVKLPTPCGNLKVRYLPFYMLCVHLLMSLFTPLDHLLSTIFGFGLTYVYIRHIKRNGNARGDPDFKLSKLFPTCGPSDDPSSDDGNDRGGPGFMMPEERHNYELDTGARPAPRQQNTQRNLFQGQARTLGDA